MDPILLLTNLDFDLNNEVIISSPIEAHVLSCDDIEMIAPCGIMLSDERTNVIETGTLHGIIANIPVNLPVNSHALSTARCIQTLSTIWRAAPPP